MGKALNLILRLKESANLIPGKFPGMKNAQYWEVISHDGKGGVIIRCETRVAKVNLNSGKAILSDNGKTGYKDIDNLKGMEVPVPSDMLMKIKKLELNKAA